MKLDLETTSNIDRRRRRRRASSVLLASAAAFLATSSVDAGGTRGASAGLHSKHRSGFPPELLSLLESKRSASPTSPLDSRILASSEDDIKYRIHQQRDLSVEHVPKPNHSSASQSRPEVAAERIHDILHNRSPESGKGINSISGGHYGFGAQNEPKPVTLSLRLSLPSVGQSNGQTTKDQVLQEQLNTIERIKELVPEVKVLGQTQLVLNSVFLRFPNGIHPQDLDVLSAHVEGIKRVTPMGHYRTMMQPTEKHVGAKAAQDMYGYDGTGVKVAVLDTGVDYTHANLGGNGTVDAYIAAIGVDPFDPRNKERDGLFPTPKVVDGYDFVGEVSAGEDDDEYIEFDDDPIDAGGHGTSVADTIAGLNGVAPGASIVALKVCAGQGGCPGMSIAMGIEYAVENGVSIINLSLGSDYGQAFDDELVLAIDAASAMGVLTIASAANCGDNPYCTGTPGAAVSAMSVAQTTVPGDFLPFVIVESSKYEASHFPWSASVDEKSTLFQGEVQYGDGEFGNTDGCLPFAPGSLEGKVVMVDRGACFFSDKVINIEEAGGVATIVANNVEGPPFPGGFGGGPYPLTPGYMVSLEAGDEIREMILVSMVAENYAPVAKIDFNEFVPTALSMAASSARGPDMSFNRIKPEIGAPGANLVADFGTGNEVSIFGGTSGAAPVVAGAAALVKQACPDCSPLALKAMLMNTAFRGIKSDTDGGQAEITRIGAGELRADNALAATFLAYSPDDEAPSFSLGQLDVTEDTVIRRRMRIVNLLQEEQTVSIEPRFRLEENGQKIAIEAYDSNNVLVDEVTLSTCDDTVLDLVFSINSAAIEANFMNSGSQGSNAAALTANEIDGYVVISDGSNEIGVPFHALARRAAKVVTSQDVLSSAYPDRISLENQGAGTAQIDVFDLVAISDDLPEGAAGSETPTPDIRAVGVRTLLADRDECDGGFALEFAINSWERQAHLLPVTYYVFIDIDMDGELDYAVWNGISDDGAQMQTIATSLISYERTTKYFAEHATNTANTVLRVCGDQIGLNLEEHILQGKRQEMFIEVEAYDYLYGGPGDILANFTIKPFGERYTDNPGLDSSRVWPLRENNMDTRSDVPPRAESDLFIYDMLNGQESQAHESINSKSYGALVFTNSNRGEGARGAATQETEALLLLAPGVTGPKELNSDTVNDVNADGVGKEDIIIDEGIVCRAARLTPGPSLKPTRAPTDQPTLSKMPTTHPTQAPTNQVTLEATLYPTFEPTTEPATLLPSYVPTARPTVYGAR